MKKDVLHPFLPEYTGSDPLATYRAQFHEAITRNATLERLASTEQIPYTSMVVFADLMETFPAVPLKTQADYGVYYREYPFATIVKEFFSKIALDVQKSGHIPTSEGLNIEQIDKLLEKSATGAFTQKEFSELLSAGINPTIVPNFITTRRLRAAAQAHGVLYENVPLPTQERSYAFADEWQDAMRKNEYIETMANDYAPKEAVAAFARFLKSYPFIPLKVSSQIASERAAYDFPSIVDEFFSKCSDLVIYGEPIKKIASQQSEIAHRVINSSGLTMQILTSSHITSLSRIEGYNGQITPCTIPNLITAERLLLTQSS